MPITLPGKYDTLDIQVIFNPSSPGVLNDTLTITSNDGTIPQTRVALRGRGLLIAKAQAGVAYAAGGTASQLFASDRTSGATTLIGLTGTTSIAGMAVHPTTNELYATVPIASGTELYRISSESGEALLTATIPVTRIRGIAFQPNGTLFGVVDGELYEINASTGKAIQIGSSSGARYAGLSFNPLTNKLYAADLIQDKIYTLNPITAKATLVGSTGLGANFAIAFGPHGILYGITRTNDFIRIDTTTGAGTLIGHISGAGISALAMRTDAVLTNVGAEHESPLPATYQLEQNYPNPFNPSTTISYNLPKSVHVKLVIYNVLGKEVRQLVDATQSAGHHQITWNGKNEAGSSVASGLYFYKIKAGEFGMTRKLMLMR